jgi:hypothetical protein
MQTNVVAIVDCSDMGDYVLLVPKFSSDGIACLLGVS